MKTKISTSGTDTQEAGNIRLTISDTKTAIAYTGTHQGSLSYQDELRLIAIGKNGSNGSNGVKGANGSPGFDGLAATKFSVGTDGGNGSDGGHGGAGTNGEPAGNGGNIDIFIDKNDLALLPIITKMDTAPGIPGGPGQHGPGGIGGIGGAGGPSFSWSEPSVVPNENPKTYFNPGGKKGLDGAPGGSYSFPLSAGIAGKPGHIKIHVKDNETESVHEQPFDLKLKYIQSHPKENHGLWEPGDEITVTYAIKNRAPTMPSPLEAIPLILRDSRYLQCIQAGEVAGSIDPEKSLTTGDVPLKLKILAPIHTATATPYKQDISFTVNGFNSRLKINFANLASTVDLTLQYPVKLMIPKKSHYKAGRGEPKTLQVHVINQSTKTLGKKTRAVICNITDASTGKVIKSDAIECLEPGKLALTETTVWFNDEDDYGCMKTFHANLFLQPIDKNLKPVLIQRQQYTIQLATKYLANQSGFLLVINDKTPESVIKFWTDNLTQLANSSSIAVWNTSYYGVFNLTSEKKPLLKDTANGSVVVLDNLFTKDNESVYNSAYITQEQLLLASQIQDTSLVVVGNEALTLASISRTDPKLTWPEKQITYPSQEALIQQLLQETENSPLVVHTFSMPIQPQENCYSTYVSAGHRVSELNTLLFRIFPERNYHISIIKEYHDHVVLGLRRLANAYNQGFYRLNKEASLQQLIKVMPLSQKLRLFTQVTNHYHPELASAIREDLLTEYKLLSASETYGSFFDDLTKNYQRDFKNALGQFNQLLSCLEDLQTTHLQYSKRWSLLVIELIAKLQNHAESQSTFWTRLAHSLRPEPVEAVKESLIHQSQKALLHFRGITKMTAQETQAYLFFFKNLHRLEEKARALTDEKAKNAADTLVSTITETLQHFAEDENTNMAAFNLSCQKAITDKRATLEAHRGILGILDTLLTILLAVLTPVGSILTYPAYCQWRNMNAHSYGFFKTASATILDDLSESLLTLCSA